MGISDITCTLLDVQGGGNVYIPKINYYLCLKQKLW